MKGVLVNIEILVHVTDVSDVIIFFFYSVELSIWKSSINSFDSFKDTHREKAPSKALTKSMNMGIWVVGISN